MEQSEIFYEEIRSKQEYYSYLIDISFELELLILKSIDGRETKLKSLLGMVSYDKIIDEHYNDIRYIRDLIIDCSLGSKSEMTQISTILSDIQIKYS